MKTNLKPLRILALLMFGSFFASCLFECIEKPQVVDLSVNPAQLETISYQGGEINLQVFCQSEWKLKNPSLPEWLDVNLKIGKGLENVKMTVKENKVPCPRQDELIFESSSGTVVRVEVNQEAIDTPDQHQEDQN